MIWLIFKKKKIILIVYKIKLYFVYRLYMYDTHLKKYFSPESKFDIYDNIVKKNLSKNK